MDKETARAALRSGCPVAWRGKMNYERMTGTLTALTLRFIGNEYVLSAEITDPRTHNTMMCRLEEIEYWNAQYIHGGTVDESYNTERL